MNEEKKNDAVDHLFAQLQGQWDTEEPVLGHHKRFMDRLEEKQEPGKKSILWIITPIAAALVMVMGLLFLYVNHPAGNTTALNKMSPKTRETQEYFTMVIKTELAKIKRENTAETRQLITDTEIRMNELEADYKKLTQELQAKGESKKIIHAMITNLQTRISFLEDVLNQIENIKKIKENYYESNT